MSQEGREATLLLIRHGETVWNVEGRIQGQHDSPLTPRGQEQGRRVAERLAAVKLDAVYSSDLGRARATAEMIAAPHGLPVQTQPALRERSFGVLEGSTLEEAARTQGLWFLTWQADRLQHAPPGGENQPDLCQRVMPALQAIASAHPGQNVAVVTHGGPIKSALFDILRIPLSLWNLTWVSNGSITILRGGAGVFRVVCWNDTCHLHHLAPGGDQVED